MARRGEGDDDDVALPSPWSLGDDRAGDDAYSQVEYVVMDADVAEAEIARRKTARGVGFTAAFTEDESE